MTAHCKGSFWGHFFWGGGGGLDGRVEPVPTLPSDVKLGAVRPPKQTRADRFPAAPLLRGCTRSVEEIQTEGLQQQHRSSRCVRCAISRRHSAA